MYNIRAVIMISEATIYAEEVPGLGWITFLISLFISHCANSHWHTFNFVSISFWLWQCLVSVCRVNTGLWAQGPGASDNFIVDHCLKCIKLLSVRLLQILFSTFLTPRLPVVHNNIRRPDTKLNCKIPGILRAVFFCTVSTF